jgi:EAL domain-containing protein (putative c-di-GMP-specific phosphodiesterase class I)
MTQSTGCSGCRDGAGFDTPITMAFQPIIDVTTGRVFAHEALVRGADGAGAYEVLSQVSEDNRYAFDQACRVKAIEMAADLGVASQGAYLSINFLPAAVYEPRACIRATLLAAMRTGFPLNQIVFEFTESERLDTAHVLNILRTYRAMGFKTALDDFGAAFAGVGLLSKFQPDIVKLDMGLIRDIDRDKTKRIIVKSTVDMLRDLDILTICEGIERVEEYKTLCDLGVSLMQGYLFARPALASLAASSWMDGELLSKVA